MVSVGSVRTWMVYPTFLAVEKTSTAKASMVGRASFGCLQVSRSCVHSEQSWHWSTVSMKAF